MRRRRSPGRRGRLHLKRRLRYGRRGRGRFRGGGRQVAQLARHAGALAVHLVRHLGVLRPRRSFFPSVRRHVARKQPRRGAHVHRDVPDQVGVLVKKTAVVEVVLREAGVAVPHHAVAVTRLTFLGTPLEIQVLLLGGGGLDSARALADPSPHRARGGRGVYSPRLRLALECHAVHAGVRLLGSGRETGEF